MIDLLSAEGFRKKLAGLSTHSLVGSDRDAVSESVCDFVSILPELFGDDLDRKTLWDRIGNGLAVSTSKCGGDLDLFVNHMLGYIKADPGSVAANQSLGLWVAESLKQSDEWKLSFLRYAKSRSFLVVVKARNLWKAGLKTKKQKKEVVGE